MATREEDTCIFVFCFVWICWMLFGFGYMGAGNDPEQSNLTKSVVKSTLFRLSNNNNNSNGGYVLVDLKKSFDESNNYCREWFGTELATIKNEEENRIVGNLCQNYPNQDKYDRYTCWIGLTKNDADGLRYWQDNTSYNINCNQTYSDNNSYCNWQTSVDPIMGGTSDEDKLCAGITTCSDQDSQDGRNVSDFIWYEKICENRYMFVCNYYDWNSDFNYTNLNDTNVSINRWIYPWDMDYDYDYDESIEVDISNDAKCECELENGCSALLGDNMADLLYRVCTPETGWYYQENYLNESEIFNVLFISIYQLFIPYFFSIITLIVFIYLYHICNVNNCVANKNINFNSKCLIFVRLISIVNLLFTIILSCIVLARLWMEINNYFNDEWNVQFYFNSDKGYDLRCWWILRTQTLTYDKIFQIILIGSVSLIDVALVLPWECFMWCCGCTCSFCLCFENCAEFCARCDCCNCDKGRYESYDAGDSDDGTPNIFNCPDCCWCCLGLFVPCIFCVSACTLSIITYIAVIIGVIGIMIWFYGVGSVILSILLLVIWFIFFVAKLIKAIHIYTYTNDRSKIIIVDKRDFGVYYKLLGKIVIAQVPFYPKSRLQDKSVGLVVESSESGDEEKPANEQKEKEKEKKTDFKAETCDDFWRLKKEFDNLSGMFRLIAPFFTVFVAILIMHFWYFSIYVWMIAKQVEVDSDAFDLTQLVQYGFKSMGEFYGYLFYDQFRIGNLNFYLSFEWLTNITWYDFNNFSNFEISVLFSKYIILTLNRFVDFVTSRIEQSQKRMIMKIAQQELTVYHDG